jgi:hypothetical protein
MIAQTSTRTYDVIVVGSGSAGSSAAIASARVGAQTVLIERGGFLGGTSTNVLDTFYAFFTPGKTPRKVVAGIGDDVLDALRAEDACFERPNTYGAGTGITYDPEVLKRVWERLVIDAGADILLHALVIDAVIDFGGSVRGVAVATKSGLIRIEADVVVDASGDADVVHLAGGPYESPSERTQSLSTVFRLANVDQAKASALSKEELWQLMKAADAAGEYALPRLEGSIHRTPHDGVVMALMTRMRHVDATDADALSAAEIEGRRQCHEYHRFLRDQVPGYERSVMISTSPAVGVRESRRVLGDHILTAEEVLGGAKFADQIAQCGAPIEDHHAGTDTQWVYLQDGGTYGIPYRTLLPRGLEGVLVAGRCFSASHDAHASARSMATCMAMGQAAGTAAALSQGRGCTPRELDPDELRHVLRSAGADLGDPS